jgi:hypothetical protein
MASLCLCIRSCIERVKSRAVDECTRSVAAQLVRGIGREVNEMFAAWCTRGVSVARVTCHVCTVHGDAATAELRLAVWAACFASVRAVAM